MFVSKRGETGKSLSESRRITGWKGPAEASVLPPAPAGPPRSGCLTPHPGCLELSMEETPQPLGRNASWWLDRTSPAPVCAQCLLSGH